MSMEVTYRMPSQGLGTDFSQFDRPINFASVYTNRFRNITGGAERRPGMFNFTSASVAGGPNLTRIHEFVDQTGDETLMVSDDSGNLWVLASANTGGVGSMTIVSGGTPNQSALANNNIVLYFKFSIGPPPGYGGDPLYAVSAGGTDFGQSMPGDNLQILATTVVSGAITGLGTIFSPGSGFSIGDNFTVGGFGVGPGSLLTVNSLVNPVANYSWNQVLSGKSPVRMISAEANNKLIFCNGVDRNFYTDDAGTTFNELKSLITEGTLSSTSSATAVSDGNITNWIGATLVSNNDIVFNSTINAYGLVTAVASAKLTVTTMGSAGIGAGNATNDQGGGQNYQLIDYVSLNIIPDGGNGKTNVATATSATSPTVIAVSGINFANTEIRQDDFIYNSTRGGIAHVGSVSANVNLKETMTGQVAGDALVFFKSAMPIASWVHVHYGRVYYLDSRNNQRVVISAPDDPQDVTTFQQTLDGSSYQFGTQQPSADAMLSMNSFLSYFVISGKRNLYIYQGNTPIQDTSQTTINFTPIAFYPNGLAGRFGLASNGGDLLHVTVDGLQAISIGYNAFSLNQNNASVPILNTLRNAIAAQTSTDNIQLTYYPRRRWLINKIGDQCFILNTQPSYDQTGQQTTTPAWHLFSGLWAQQNHYFVRRGGDLLACGANGMVYTMDSSASTDVGSTISTDLVTAWLRLEEPQVTRRVKEGHFIEPVFESAPNLEYTINVRAGLDNLSSDSITVSAGGTGAIGSFIVGQTAIGTGSFAQANKFPLRWRGEEFRVEFITQTSATPDIITGFTVLGNVTGRR